MRSDFWSGFAVMGASAALLFWIIPHYGGRGLGGSISPKFMPTIGATIMLVCACVVTGKAMWRMQRTRISPVNWPDGGRFLRLAWPFAFVAAAVMVISSFGLIYSGPLMIAAMLVILGETRPTVVAAAALIPPAIIWFLATQLMRVGMI